jgi:hypothetical protein
MPHDSYPIILSEKIGGNYLIGGRAETLIAIGVIYRIPDPHHSYG